LRESLQYALFSVALSQKEQKLRFSEVASMLKQRMIYLAAIQPEKASPDKQVLEEGPLYASEDIHL